MEKKTFIENLKVIKKNHHKFFKKIYLKNGRFKYSLSADIIPHFLPWGQNNTIYALKSLYTLNYKKEKIKHSIKYLKKQYQTNQTHDRFLKYYSLPIRLFKLIKKKDTTNFCYKKTEIAEERQLKSCLIMYNEKIKNKKTSSKYLKKLNWEDPWGSGSHISHGLFNNALIKNIIEIKKIIQIIKNIEKLDGYWYSGNVSDQNKINGAMKILTGLEFLKNKKIKIDYKPKYEKILIKALKTTSSKDSCRNFNISYVIIKTFKNLSNQKKKKIQREGRKIHIQ